MLIEYGSTVVENEAVCKYRLQAFLRFAGEQVSVGANLQITFVTHGMTLSIRFEISTVTVHMSAD